MGCAGAHGAGFQCGVEGTIGQAPAAEGGGGVPEGEEFGVGCGIPCGLTLVGGDGEDLFSPSDHCPYGYFTPLGGGFCGEEGAAHHGEIRRFYRVGGEPLVHGADNIRERARIACQSRLCRAGLVRVDGWVKNWPLGRWRFWCHEPSWAVSENCRVRRYGNYGLASLALIRS